MRKTIKHYLTFAFAGLLLGSCAESDLVVDQVLDGVTNGAVLRTISVDASVINSSDPTSLFQVQVEEQDTQDGALFESVDLKVTLNDLTPDNGTTVVESVQVKNIPASDFSPGPHGLPRGTISAVFSEIFPAMGISIDDIAPGDVFVMELHLNLTDGRTFGPASAGGIITGGFFSSPFQYNALITCSPNPGVYVVDMHDSYGDGWQTTDSGAGDGLMCDIDGTVTAVAMCSLWGTYSFPCAPGTTDASDSITIPAGTESALWSWGGDFYGEITFEIYGPSGNLLYESPSGPGSNPVGLLPVTECAQ